MASPPLGAPTSYQVVHGWPQLPEGHILGQATGVDIDSHGNVFVFHRAGRSRGGDLFLMPHGLTIDHQDNVWVTDVLLHQVFKFSPSGELLLAIGRARVPGNDREHFDMPTDVAVLPDGSI